MPSLRGRGIKESVDKRLNARPKAITTFLNKHGHETIKRIIVCRTPLAQAFIKIGVCDVFERLIGSGVMGLAVSLLQRSHVHLECASPTTLLPEPAPMASATDPDLHRR